MRRSTPFIVAELSGEHCGTLENALTLVKCAALAGADAIKIQCFTPEQMADPGVVIQSGPWQGRELLDLYRQTHTPREWIPAIFARAHELDLVPFSSVFHRDDVDFLETLDCPIYKISSFEALDHDLIEHAAQTGKPMMISTGMCSTEEIDELIKAAQFGGCTDLTILKCTSAYPAPINEFNLASITSLLYGWDIQVGLSDHSKSHIPAVMAIALGATVIEKHLTLQTAANGGAGLDAAFALDPDEFAVLVSHCQIAKAALGRHHLGPVPSEESSLPLRRPRNGKRGQKA